MLYFHDSYAITYRNFRPIIVAIISFLFLQFYDLIRYRQFSYKVYIRNNTCIYKFINNKKFSQEKNIFSAKEELDCLEICNKFLCIKRTSIGFTL